MRFTPFKPKTWLNRVGKLLMAIALLAMTLPSVAAMRLASFNVEHLGWNNDKDISAVARIIGQFDLVAIQEVMKSGAVDALERELEGQTGEGWSSMVSDAVGRSSYQEHYAFVWRDSGVSYEGGAASYLDPGDVFAREPLSAVFMDRETRQAFALGTVHIIYGDDRSDRRPEVRALDDYVEWLRDSQGVPTIVVGDFNMPPGDPSWREMKTVLQPMITQGATTLSPVDGRFASLYDNIWLDPREIDVTSKGVFDFPSWLGITHQTARDHISDHAPVYITIGGARVSSGPVAGRTANDREPSHEPAGGSCVDLNKGSLEQLDTLPQVGPSRAAAIIAQRPWAKAGDLVRINGLSAGRVRVISQAICPL